MFPDRLSSPRSEVSFFMMSYFLRRQKTQNSHRKLSLSREASKNPRIYRSSLLAALHSAAYRNIATLKSPITSEPTICAEGIKFIAPCSPRSLAFIGLLRAQGKSLQRGRTEYKFQADGVGSSEGFVTGMLQREMQRLQENIIKKQLLPMERNG